MTDKEFSQLLATVTSGEPLAAREAGRTIRREIERSRSWSEHKYADTFWHAVQVYPKISKPHNLGELLGLTGLFAWGLGDRHGTLDPRFELASEFTFFGMTHSSGTIRERARKAAGYFRISLMGPILEPTDDSSDRYGEYVHRIERLIARHRPGEPTLAQAPHIEDLKPSPYKTLLIHWNDMGGGIIAEQFVNLSRARELKLPIYEYYDDEWVEATRPVRDDIAEILWDCEPTADPRSVKDVMAKLETLTVAQLRRVLKRHGISEDSITKVEAQTTQYGTQAGLKALFDVITDSGRNLTPTKPGNEVEWLDVMRRIETRAAFMTGDDGHGRLICGFLVESALTKAEYDKQDPALWTLYLDRVLKTHQQLLTLEDLLKQLHAPDPELAKLLTSVELAEYSVDDHIAGLAEIAHYALDWWAMSEPWTMLKREPSALAAVAWYLVERANPGVSAISHMSVAEFGGWKSTSSLSSTGNRAYMSVIEKLESPAALALAPSLRVGE
jgi:hypothetical protein